MNITDELVEKVAKKLSLMDAERRMHPREAAKEWRQTLTERGRNHYRRDAREILELISKEESA
ncbi:hypothetical protein [Nonomuraea typhae]|uniref:Uncharacterized protein n=1 Tax=Nonomuraea typhae TaxID=2603600 RepID=A0ABW7YJV7_9ACTN